MDPILYEAADALLHSPVVTIPSTLPTFLGCSCLYLSYNNIFHPPFTCNAKWKRWVLLLQFLVGRFFFIIIIIYTLSPFCVVVIILLLLLLFHYLYIAREKFHTILLSLDDRTGRTGALTRKSTIQTFHSIFSTCAPHFIAPTSLPSDPHASLHHILLPRVRITYTVSDIRSFPVFLNALSRQLYCDVCAWARTRIHVQ